jgi:hypothetical protein
MEKILEFIRTSFSPFPAFLKETFSLLLVELTGQLGMLTPFGHLIPPLVYPGVHVFFQFSDLYRSLIR